MRKLFLLTLAFGIVACFSNCKKKKADDPRPAAAVAPPSITASKSFSNVTFNRTNQWFTTAGASSYPKDSASAKLVESTLDIGYTYDISYDEPGFLDLVTRSEGTYYWSSTFYTPWTSVAKKVNWYKTTITTTEFNTAKADETKIAQYFTTSGKVTMVSAHPIWPDGTCIGGRNAVDTLTVNKVYAFRRLADGKRGLMKINSLPLGGGLNTDTSVDIIREN